jgi:hypothetical protein
MAPVNLLPTLHTQLYVVSPGMETATAAEACDLRNDDDVEEPLKSIAETLMSSPVLPGPKTSKDPTIARVQTPKQPLPPPLVRAQHKYLILERTRGKQQREKEEEINVGTSPQYV